MAEKPKAVISRQDPELLLNGQRKDPESDGQAQVQMDLCQGIEPAQDQEQEVAPVVNRPDNGDSENVGCAKGWSPSCTFIQPCTANRDSPRDIAPRSRLPILAYGCQEREGLVP